MTTISPELERTVFLANQPTEAWSASDRAAVVDQLTRLLVRHDELDVYVTRLTDPSHPLMPFLGSFADPELEHDFIPPGTLTQILADGPTPFSDWTAEQLRRLLRNPSGLYEMASFIHETVPKPWRPLLLAEARKFAPPPPAKPGTAVPAKPSSRAGARPWIVGLAASVLLNCAIGYYALRGPFVGDASRGRPPIVVASLTKSDGGRGADTLWDIQVTADGQGFATVVLLRPGKRPEVGPRPGEPLLVVRPNEPTRSPLESRDLGPNCFALTVVTPQPANLLLLGHLKFAFDPADRDAVQRQVATILADHGYETVSFQWTLLQPE